MEIIKKLFDSIKQRDIAIYGLGEVGYVILHSAMAAEANIKYLIDKNKAGTIIEGIGVKDLYDIVDDIANLNVIVCIGDDVEQKKVKSQLLELGVNAEQLYFPSDFFIANPSFDIFDTMLGYDKQYEIDGYKIYPSRNEGNKVVIYGGSTTDHCYATFPSWPEEFALLFNNTQEGMTVYNGAARGYCTKQEMLKCVRDIPTLKPNVVISYHGINDALKYANAKSDTEVKAHFPDDYLKGVVEMFFKSGKVSSYKKAGYGLEDDNDLIINWLNHLRVMHAVCEEYGAEFHAFIQPSMFYGHYEMSDYDLRFMKLHSSEEFSSNMKTFYKSVIELSKDIPYIHDCTDMFSGKTGMYIDYVHASLEGNKEIARYIANFININIK